MMYLSLIIRFHLLGIKAIEASIMNSIIFISILPNINKIIEQYLTSNYIYITDNNMNYNIIF